MVNEPASRAARGSGSVRQRSPGVWEIRVVVGFDPIRARSLQRSLTVRGDAELAEHRRQELVEDIGASRVLFSGESAGVTVADLLDRWLAAPHLWKRATAVSHTSVARTLLDDPLGRRRLVLLTQSDVIAAICRWQTSGVSVPTVSGP
jgi:hypothetical protein